MTKMKNWAGSNVIARLSYCHCEPSFLPSLRAHEVGVATSEGGSVATSEGGSVATRYNSDEAVGQAVNDIIGKKA